MSALSVLLLFSAILQPGMVKSLNDELQEGAGDKATREETMLALLEKLTNRQEESGALKDIPEVEKQGIVDSHNYLRSSVSPSAGNMRYVVSMKMIM